MVMSMSMRERKKENGEKRKEMRNERREKIIRTDSQSQVHHNHQSQPLQPQPNLLL